MSEHSPGPWRESSDGFHVEDANGDAICELILPGVESRRGNAALLALAPELLEDHRLHCDEWNGRHVAEPCSICARVEAGK